MRRQLTAGLMALGLVVLSACRQQADTSDGKAAEPRAPQAIAIDIKGMQFVPASAVAHVGDTIVWHNSDIVPHTATAAGTFDTGDLQVGASGRAVLERAGVIDYLCAYHSTMRARIEVQQ
jgi:plastocyanin